MKTRRMIRIRFKQLLYVVGCLAVFCSGCALPYSADISNRETEYGPLAEGLDKNIPKPIAETGHSHEVTELAVSQDGKCLLSASKDWSIIMWNIGEQRIIHRFAGHAEEVTSIGLSHNGHYLVSGSMDETIRIWDVRTGKELRRITIKPPKWLDIGSKLDFAVLVGKWYKGVYAVVWSPDDKYILCSSKVGLWLIEWETGKQVRHFDPPGIGAIFHARAIAFSPDGKHAIADNYLLEISTGLAVKEFQEKKKIPWVTCSAFAPSGKLVATGHEDGYLRVWEVSSGLQVYKIKAHDTEVLSMAFNIDGKYLATGGKDKIVRIWNTESGEEIKRIANWYEATAIAFHPYAEKPFIFTSAFSGTLLWSLDSGKIISVYFGIPAGPRHLAITKEGEYVITDTSDGLRVWELKSGRQVYHLEGHKKPGSFMSAISVNKKDGYLLSGYYDGTISVWDLKSAKEIHRYVGHKGDIRSLALNPNDERYFLSGSSNSIGMWLWDMNKGTAINRYSGNFLYYFFSTVSAVDFNPIDTKFGVAGFRDESLGIRLYNLETGELLRTFGGFVAGFVLRYAHTSSITSVAFSPKANYIVSGSRDDTVRVWNANTGKQIDVFNAGHDVKSVSADPGEKYVLAVIEDSVMKVWNIQTGQLEHTLRGHWAEVESAAFTPDGKFIISCSADNTLRFWDVKTGQTLLIYATNSEGEWIAYTPEGLFDGSYRGWNNIMWQFGNADSAQFETVPIEIYFKEYYYPGLMAEILAGNYPRPSHQLDKKDRRQPEIDIEIVNAEYGSQVDNRTATVKIKVKEAGKNDQFPKGSGVQDLRLFRNGSLVKIWPNSVLKNDSEATLSETISLVAGINEISAYAFNSDNIKSKNAITIVKGGESLKRKGIAYILAFGINEYSNSAWNLNYAVNDAESITKNLKQSLDKLGTYAQVVPVTLQNGKAKKENILTALKLLSGTITSLPAGAPEEFRKIRRAEPEDDIILYFSGHGMADKNRYYLIPHDMGYQGRREDIDYKGKETVKNHSLSDEDLNKGLRRVDAGRIMLIIDACQSGQALEAEEKRRGPMNSRGLAQLAYEKGIYILAAAQSDQAAREFSKLGHGLLTYTLLEKGLNKFEADANKDSRVTAEEWMDYATRYLSQGIDEANSAYVKEKGVGVDADQITITGQSPRAYYRRERVEDEWVVGKK